MPNRRFFERFLCQEWQRCRREVCPLSLLLADLDYFKTYNDCYGHLAGDHCLRQVAQALQAVLKRPSDFIARYGGEEFAIVLPNTLSSGAEAVAQQLGQAIPQILHQAENRILARPPIKLLKSKTPFLQRFCA